MNKIYFFKVAKFRIFFFKKFRSSNMITSRNCPASKWSTMRKSIWREISSPYRRHFNELFSRPFVAFSHSLSLFFLHITAFSNMLTILNCRPSSCERMPTKIRLTCVSPVTLHLRRFSPRRATSPNPCPHRVAFVSSRGSGYLCIRARIPVLACISTVYTENRPHHLHSTPPSHPLPPNLWRIFPNHLNRSGPFARGSWKSVFEYAIRTIWHRSDRNRFRAIFFTFVSFDATKVKEFLSRLYDCLEPT